MLKIPYGPQSMCTSYSLCNYYSVLLSTEQVEWIVRSIAPEILRPYLYSAGVIDANTYEKLLVMEAARQHKHLLMLLNRSGVEGLLRFRKALKKARDAGYVGHNIILQRLEEKFNF